MFEYYVILELIMIFDVTFNSTKNPAGYAGFVLYRISQLNSFISVTRPAYSIAIKPTKPW